MVENRPQVIKEQDQEPQGLLKKLLVWDQRLKILGKVKVTYS